MSDALRMQHLAGRARARGERCVLATLVRTSGESLLAPGARAVVAGTAIAGLLSSSATDNALLAAAAELLASTDADAPIANELEITVDRESLSVVLEVIKGDVEGPMDWLRAHMESEVQGVVAHLPFVTRADGTNITDANATAGAPRRVWKIAGQVVTQGVLTDEEKTQLSSLCDAALARHAGDGERVARTTTQGGVLVEVLPPPVSLLVVGAATDAFPIVDIATALGWRVTVIDARADALAHPRFASTRRLHVPVAEIAQAAAAVRARAVLVMADDLRLETEALAGLLAADATPREYIGHAGAKSRMRTIASCAKLPASVLASVRAPAGFDLGGVGTDAIALSIIAEIQAVLHGRTAQAARRA